MKKLHKFLMAGSCLMLTVAPLTAAQAQDRASERSERTQRILEHWTADRIAGAQPRDMVIDHRGKAFIRGKRGALRSYGHNFRPELTSDTRRIRGQRSDNISTTDFQAPVVTSRTPANNAVIGASQTFSAVVTDRDGVRSVNFEITYNGETTTFAGKNVGNDTYEVTVDGFTTGSGSWRVISEDNNRFFRRNRGATPSFDFTVDTNGGGDGGDGGDGPDGGDNGGGGVVANSRWTNGGAIQTAAGRLFYEMPNNGGWSGYVCSGTVATDGTTGRSIILTAAHCVYDDADRAFARNVIFIPNQDQTTGSATDRNCSNDPEGCWVTDFGVVEQNWTTRTFPDNAKWDYGYYVVNDSGNHSGNGRGGALDSAVGSFEVDFSKPNVDDGQDGEFSSDWTHALGYSYSDDPYFMYAADDMTVDTYLDRSGNTNWFVPSSKLSGGASGGPWIQPMDESRGTGPIISVNSWAFTNGNPGMAGPRLHDTTAQCLFDKSKTASLNLANNRDGQQGLIVDPASCGGSTPPPDDNDNGNDNNPPTAKFSESCTDLSCSFTDESSDRDGSVSSYSWDFGDRSTSTSKNPSHSYSSAGTYTVTLTVTDNDGASANTSKNITVSAPADNENPLCRYSPIFCR